CQCMVIPQVVLSCRCMNQKSPIVSPPFMVPIAIHVFTSMLLVMNRTDPSHIEALTPLGCLLRTVLLRLAPVVQGSSLSGRFMQKLGAITSGAFVFGVINVIK